MPSVESVVVWSSMSRVTVAPTRRASVQIVRAWSRAICSPSPGKAWPMALSLTLTSAAGGQRVEQRREVGGLELAQQLEIGRRDRVGVRAVGGVLAEVVEGDGQPGVDQRLAWPRPPTRCPPRPTKRRTTLRETGAWVTRLSIRRLRAAARIVERSMRSRLTAPRWPTRTRLHFRLPPEFATLQVQTG